MSERVQVRATADAGRAVFALQDFAAGDTIQADGDCFAIEYMNYAKSGRYKEQNVAELNDAYVLAMHLLLFPERCKQFNDVLAPATVQCEAGFHAILRVKALRLAASRDARFHQLADVPSQTVALTMAQCRTNFFTTVLRQPKLEVMVFFVLSKVMAMYNHSCNPNAQFQFLYEPKTNMSQAVMVALKPIAKGDEICCSYLNPYRLQASLKERRSDLSIGWNFDCKCSRCQTAEQLPAH